MIGVRLGAAYRIRTAKTMLLNASTEAWTASLMTKVSPPTRR